MRDSLLFSFEYTRSSMRNFVSEQPLLFVIITIILIWSIIAQTIKKKLKQKYILPYENKVNTENQYFYIKYFKKIHAINSIGILLILGLLFIYLITKIEIIGSVLAIGVGAVILTFQTFVVSFVMYFLLSKKYQVGDHIKVSIDGENIQGEILNIGSLYIGIAGKNEYGENTDEFHYIPNNQLWLNPICKINLSQNNYIKESFNIIYDKNDFEYSFDETTNKIKDFLDHYLPLRAASQVGNYKTFIGVRYKTSFFYEDGKTHIWIGFLTRRKDEGKKMQAILSFIESLKTSYPKN